MAQPKFALVIDTPRGYLTVSDLVSACGVKPVGNNKLIQTEWLLGVTLERLRSFARLIVCF